MNISNKQSTIKETTKANYTNPIKTSSRIQAVEPVTATPAISLKDNQTNARDSSTLSKLESHLDNILSNFYDLKDSFYKKRKKNSKYNIVALIEEFISNFNSFVVTLEMIDNILNTDYISIISFELAKNKDLLFRYGIIILNDYELELRKYILEERIKKGDIENLIGKNGIITELILVIKNISITKHTSKKNIKLDDFHGAIIDSKA